MLKLVGLRTKLSVILGFYSIIGLSFCACFGMKCPKLSNSQILPRTQTLICAVLGEDVWSMNWPPWIEFFDFCITSWDGHPRWYNFRSMCLLMLHASCIYIGNVHFIMTKTLSYDVSSSTNPNSGLPLRSYYPSGTGGPPATGMYQLWVLLNHGSDCVQVCHHGGPRDDSASPPDHSSPGMTCRLNTARDRLTKF